jgi:hypothetical protein
MQGAVRSRGRRHVVPHSSEALAVCASQHEHSGTTVARRGPRGRSADRTALSRAHARCASSHRASAGRACIAPTCSPLGRPSAFRSRDRGKRPARRASISSRICADEFGFAISVRFRADDKDVAFRIDRLNGAPRALLHRQTHLLDLLEGGFDVRDGKCQFDARLLTRSGW